MSGIDLEPDVMGYGNFASVEGCAVKVAFEAALRTHSTLPAEVRAIPGMSGQRYRTFINMLIATLPEPRYLEVGSWPGSTAAAAVCGNDVRAVCIDNWSQFEGSADAKKAQFFGNIDKVNGAGAVRLIEQDYRDVDYRTLGKFNVYMFDGPHSEADQEQGIVIARPALHDRFVLIIDDWNWHCVRIGTKRGLAKARYVPEACIQVRTTHDESHPTVACERSDWHNGYCFVVARKQ